MKTMLKAIKKFNKMSTYLIAELDEVNSELGFYRVAFTDPLVGSVGCIYFATCREFTEWMRGVVIE